LCERFSSLCTKQIVVSCRRFVYPVSVKDEGLVVQPQLRVGPAAGPGPAHAHIPAGQRLELKVPLPRGHRVRLLHAEEANGLDAEAVVHVQRCGVPGGAVGSSYSEAYANGNVCINR